MKDVNLEAKRRKIKSLIVPGAKAIEQLEKDHRNQRHSPRYVLK